MTCLMTVIVPLLAPPVVVTGAAQVGTVMVSVSVVTVPAPRDRARPDHTVFAPTVIALALSMMVPAKVVLAASVVAELGVQKTLQAEAPESVTVAPAVEVSAPVGRKMYVPLPFNVRGPPTSMAPVLQYTPGVYTPIGPCVVSVERSMGPGAKVKVQGWRFKPDKALAASVLAWGVGAPEP